MPNKSINSLRSIRSHPVIIVQDSILIKVDDKGRIILPSSLRKSIGIEPGETLQLSFDLANPYTLLIQRKSPEGGNQNE